MSKRYVIQVLDTITDENLGDVYDVESADEPMTGWFNLPHPSGGDWLTRSRTTAISDAARLVHEGETRKLRIGVSRPVYAVTPEVDFEAIKAAEAAINWTDAGDYEDEDDPMNGDNN